MGYYLWIYLPPVVVVLAGRASRHQESAIRSRRAVHPRHLCACSTRSRSGTSSPRTASPSRSPTTGCTRSRRSSSRPPSSWVAARRRTRAQQVIAIAATPCLLLTLIDGGPELFPNWIVALVLVGACTSLRVRRRLRSAPRGSDRGDLCPCRSGSRSWHLDRSPRSRRHRPTTGVRQRLSCNNVGRPIVLSGRDLVRGADGYARRSHRARPSTSGLAAGAPNRWWPRPSPTSTAVSSTRSSSALTSPRRRGRASASAITVLGLLGSPAEVDNCSTRSSSVASTPR